MMIPVNEPLLDGNEKKYLAECIDTGWISSEGPFVERLESGFANRVEREHGIAVCNGSAALDVAVTALGLGPGDEIIMPTFTIISCLAAVIRSGALPVLVDCDAASWNMAIDQVASKIGPRTKAIMVVHIYGFPADMDPILALARDHGLFVIEDAAEMHGSSYAGRPCGSFGDISVFSFYPNKHITTGEGGMVLTNDRALAERCRRLRNLCFAPPRRFVHEELGWNFRMSNLQAAVGVAQLERLDEFCARKRRLGHIYTKAFQNTPQVELQLERNNKAENAYWVYGIVLTDVVPFDADGAIARLRDLGVQTRPFFWPMHEQPVARARGLFHNETYPVAERIARRGFYLPSGMALTDLQADTVVRAVHEMLQ